MLQEEEIKPTIAIVGSLNIDKFLCVTQMPKLGETVAAKSIQKAFGGKGANQAVAAQRLGGQVSMLAQIGNDADGLEYLGFMRDEGIDGDHVNALTGVTTGSAFIISQENGENSIIIDGGANMAYAESISDDWKNAIAQSSLLLLQREVPERINIQSAKHAYDNGVLVVLDMGGRDDPISSELISLCDLISPNQTEVIRLIGADQSQDEETKGEPTFCIDESLAKFLTKQKPGFKLLMKQGSEGSTLICLDQTDNSLKKLHVPALKFEDYNNVEEGGEKMQLVDTTGAGDTFTAAFAVKFAQFKQQSISDQSQTRNSSSDLSEDQYRQCLQFGTKAAFICITRFGAAISTPKLSELQKLIVTDQTAQKQ